MQVTSCMHAVPCRASLRTDAPQQRSFAAPLAPKARKTHVCRVAEEVSTNGVATSAATVMDYDELTDILRMVHDTDIVELELKSKKFSLAVRKREALEPPPAPMQVVAAPPPMAVAPAVAVPPPAAPAPAPAPAPVAAAPPAPKAPAAVDGVEVLSPMSGTFYTTPAPGEPPFIKEGDVVTKGQTIGIIEAMKLMNEIEAEVGGVVTKLCVSHGTAVSPGDALVVIKPQ